MTRYMKALKSQKGMNDPNVRTLAKDYLACRMDQYVAIQISARDSMNSY